MGLGLIGLLVGVARTLIDRLPGRGKSRGEFDRRVEKCGDFELPEYAAIETEMDGWEIFVDSLITWNL